MLSLSCSFTRPVLLEPGSIPFEPPEVEAGKAVEKEFGAWWMHVEVWFRGRLLYSGQILRWLSRKWTRWCLPDRCVLWTDDTASLSLRNAVGHGVIFWRVSRGMFLCPVHRSVAPAKAPKDAGKGATPVFSVRKDRCHLRTTPGARRS